MPKIATWLEAARLRTLPLSVSGVTVGTALANHYGKSNIMIFVLALLTTVGFQVTSNLANDYGDGIKGTDNDDRVGPKRTLQSGLLSKSELKRGIIISIVFDLILVFALLYNAFGMENMEYLFLFLILGALSIWASIRYTVGQSAYGYKGLGDVFVFGFFGLLGVLGSMFLYTKFLTALAFLPAAAIGFLSVGVLNLNNLRDSQSDEKANKNTVVVKIGFENGKKYHYVLLILGFLSMLVFSLISFQSWRHLVPLIAFVPIFIHLAKVYRTRIPALLDTELKKLAMSTFAMAVLFYITYNNIL